jgi:hypothetical protein
MRVRAGERDIKTNQGKTLLKDLGGGREKDAGHGELGKKMTGKPNMAKMITVLYIYIYINQIWPK